MHVETAIVHVVRIAAEFTGHITCCNRMAHTCKILLVAFAVVVGQVCFFSHARSFVSSFHFSSSLSSAFFSLPGNGGDSALAGGQPEARAVSCVCGAGQLGLCPAGVHEVATAGRYVVITRGESNMRATTLQDRATVSQVSVSVCV